MEKTNISIAEYVESLDPKHQEVMQTMINLVTKIAPELEAAVWKGVFWGGSEQNILGFGEYDYTTKDGKTDSWFLIGLARQKAYYSLYVNAVKDGQYLLKDYKDKLGKVKIGASNVSFTKLENVAFDPLEEMLREAVSTYSN